jgi:hypothetical protein
LEARFLSKEIGEAVSDILYAGVIIDQAHPALDKVFHYRIPEDLMADIQIGMRVLVPFGAGNRNIDAYVVSLDKEESGEPVDDESSDEEPSEEESDEYQGLKKALEDKQKELDDAKEDLLDISECSTMDEAVKLLNALKQLKDGIFPGLFLI